MKYGNGYVWEKIAVDKTADEHDVEQQGEDPAKRRDHDHLIPGRRQQSELYFANPFEALLNTNEAADDSDAEARPRDMKSTIGDHGREEGDQRQQQEQDERHLHQAAADDDDQLFARG